MRPSTVENINRHLEGRHGKTREELLDLLNGIEHDIAEEIAYELSQAHQQQHEEGSSSSVPPVHPPRHEDVAPILRSAEWEAIQNVVRAIRLEGTSLTIEQVHARVISQPLHCGLMKEDVAEFFSEIGLVETLKPQAQPGLQLQPGLQQQSGLQQQPGLQQQSGLQPQPDLQPGLQQQSGLQSSSGLPWYEPPEEKERKSREDK